MSIYRKMVKASKDLDAEALMNLFHEDFVMVSHKDNSTNNKDELGEMVNYMMSSDDFLERDSRCLFENDEALVGHSVMDFPDGTSEAVLSFYKIKDGQIIRLETGATLLEK